VDNVPFKLAALSKLAWKGSAAHGDLNPLNRNRPPAFWYIFSFKSALQSFFKLIKYFKILKSFIQMRNYFLLIVLISVILSLTSMLSSTSHAGTNNRKEWAREEFYRKVQNIPIEDGYATDLYQRCEFLINFNLKHFLIHF
jgi:hypothetical protein